MVVFDSRRRRPVIGLLLAIAMVLSLFPAFVGTAEAAQVLPETVAVAQSQSGTCTLASAAMMIRARMYLSGNSKWSSITEHDIRGDVWLEGAGIYYSWTYTTVGVIITGDHEDVSGLSDSQLSALLKRHPEGIEIHCASVPHAVLVTDYTDGVFYCFDPAQYYSGRRIPLTASWLGETLGSQSSILSSITSYWYISSYSIQPDSTVPPVPTAAPSNQPVVEPTATPDVQPARELKVMLQPVDQAGSNGDKVTFTAGADGTDLTYQWQYSRDGVIWQRSSATGASATCLVNATTMGTWYRCMISDPTGQCVYSRAAQIIPEQGPVILQQPEDAVGPNGSECAISVKAEGTGLTYQWQLSTNNGKKWSNSKVTADTVSFTMNKTRNGRIYRCIVTDAAGRQTISDTARIVLADHMKIVEQPKDVVSKDGTNIIFSVVAEGENLKYQWEYTRDGGKNWQKADSTSHFFHCTASAEQNGWLYRCVITDPSSAKLTTRAASLTVAGLSFTVAPQDVTTTGLKVVRFRAAATGEDLHYQWQISSNGKAWYNAGTSQTLTVIATKTISGRLVRCVVTDGYGNYIISNPARLTVN